VDPSQKATPESEGRVREGLRVMREKRQPLAQNLPSLQRDHAEEAGIKLRK
jgi:hypothetical protein